MPVLTEVVSSEMVVPVTPSTVLRTIERRGDNRWHVLGFDREYGTPLGALLFVRTEVESHSRHPVRIEITWRGVAADFKPPSTAGGLS